MQEENKGDKIRRVLQLYAKLSDGYVINKAEEAACNKHGNDKRKTDKQWLL